MKRVSLNVASMVSNGFIRSCGPTLTAVVEAVHHIDAGTQTSFIQMGNTEGLFWLQHTKKTQQGETSGLLKPFQSLSQTHLDDNANGSELQAFFPF